MLQHWKAWGYFEEVLITLLILNDSTWQFYYKVNTCVEPYKKNGRGVTGHKSVTEGPNWKAQVQLGTKNYNVKDCLMQPVISEFAKSKKDKASTRLFVKFYHFN